jgi:hypothetical protein
MLTQKATWGILSVEESTLSKDTANPMVRLEAEFLGLLFFMIKSDHKDPEAIVREAIRR